MRQRHPARGVLLALGALSLGLIAAGCAGGPLTKDLGAVERHAFAPGPTRLEVHVEVGSLVVATAPGDTISRERRVTADAQAVEEVRGDTLHVEVSCPDGPAGRGCRAEYTLLVPRSLAVVASGDAASITVRDLDGVLDARTASGAIHADNTGGQASLAVEAGAITAARLRGPSLTAVTAAGSIELAFAEVPDLVDARTESGGIDIGLPPAGPDPIAYAVRAVAEVGGVEVEVPTSPDAGHRIDARSQAGAIRVHD